MSIGMTISASAGTASSTTSIRQDGYQQSGRHRDTTASEDAHPGTGTGRVPDTEEDLHTNPAPEDSGMASTTTTTSSSSLLSASSSLLATLWSPVSSLLQPSKSPSLDSTLSSGESKGLLQSNTMTRTRDSSTNTETSTVAPSIPSSLSSQSPPSSSSSSSSPLPISETQPQTQTQPEPEPEPEPYYTPQETPLFKTLQKTRLSGTRTKQLLRAASRAYNDPPPPPELGSCCGSSCDPCVNDLWREERDVWRERWGDRRVESGSENVDGRSKLKELEW